MLNYKSGNTRYAPAGQVSRTKNRERLYYWAGFEATLWAAADKLRGNLDAAEYKHVVLGLIFLKYIWDAFEEQRAALVAEKSEFEGANAGGP